MIFLQKISREDFMNNSVDAYISTRLRLFQAVGSNVGLN